MVDSVSALNQSLRERLTKLIQSGAPSQAEAPLARPDAEFKAVYSPRPSHDPSAPAQVVISINEINDRHGTGPLVKRVCHGHPNLFSIRSRDDWGEHDFGDWNACIPQQGCTRQESFRRVLSVLRGHRVESVLCVPFLNDELITAIAVKESFGARLCVYMMDDQNVATQNIPDGLMREFLEKCSFRVATHPELRYAYEQKYGLKFYLLPAVVPHGLVVSEPSPPVSMESQRAAIIGSFWDQSWFDRLCDALAGCGHGIDWFGNNKSPWFQFSKDLMQRAGITACGVIPEPQLAERLRQYPFVIVPAGLLDSRENNTGVASLSLPGRILFTTSTSHTPVLLVGDKRTCGARFITHFGVGEVVPYDSRAVVEAMERLQNPSVQQRMRANAARIAGAFSDDNVSSWLAESTRLGRPADNRFEDAFAGYPDAIEIPGLSMRAQSIATAG